MVSASTVAILKRSLALWVFFWTGDAGTNLGLGLAEGVAEHSAAELITERAAGTTSFGTVGPTTTAALRAGLRANQPSSTSAMALNPTLAALDIIPPLPGSAHISPVSDKFGYDPALASKIYGRDLRFVNFDPAEFPSDSVEDRRSRAALGQLISHTTSDLSVPVWARLLLDRSFGSLPSQLCDMGLLPSPYRYQLEATTKLKIKDTSSSLAGFSEHEIDVPVSFSLSETIYKYIPDEGSSETNAKPSLEANKQAEDYTAFNCMLCHGGIYGNTVIGGAANKNYNPEWLFYAQEKSGGLAFGEAWRNSPGLVNTFLSADDLLDWKGIPRQGPTFITISKASGDHLANFGDFYQEMERKVLNSATNVTVGAQAATAMVFATLSSLVPNGKTLDTWEDPKKSYYDKNSKFQRFLALYKKSDAAQPVFALSHARPWWMSRYSGNAFWFGSSVSDLEGSAGDLALFLSSPAHGNVHAPKMADRHLISLNIQTYISKIQSPPFPQPLDWDRVQSGSLIYAKSCAACHGAFVPTKAGHTINQQTHFTLDYDQAKAEIPFTEVGTERAYWDLYTKSRWLTDNGLSNGEATKYRLKMNSPSPAYEPYIFAPPLVGMWTAAPFFHNGSVPTLWQVLSSRDRPKVWTMDQDPYAYNYRGVGVVYKEGEAMHHPGEDQDTQKLHALYTYDTGLAEHGMGNQGHLYGDKLSDEERWQLIEFLKIMDTKRVSPNVIR